MSDTEILRTLFKESLFVPVNDGRVILVETGQPDSQVTICNVPDDAVCIKADEGIDLRGFFGNTARGECKRADYLLFSESRRCVLIIEIKRTKDRWSQVCQQLHGASCLASYCQKIGQTFWRDRGFLNDYQHCFASISHTVVGTGHKRESIEASVLDPKTKIKKVYHPHCLQYPKLISMAV